MENKKERLDAFTNQLHDWRSRVHEAEERANNASDEKRKKFTDRIEDLEQELRAAEKALNELRNTPDDDWEAKEKQTAQEFERLNEKMADTMSAID